MNHNNHNGIYDVMAEDLTLAVLAERLAAHQDKDALQFDTFNRRIDKVDKSLVRIHTRFDSLMLGMLCIALGTVGSLAMMVYNTIGKG